MDDSIELNWDNIKDYIPNWDIPSLLVGFLVGLSICYFIIDTYSECMPEGMCKYTRYGSDLAVTGNCKALLPEVQKVKQWDNNLQINNSIWSMVSTIPIRISNSMDPSVEFIIETTTTTTMQQPVMICPTCECPTTTTLLCAPQTIQNENILQCLNEYKPTAYNSIWQDGSHTAITYARGCAGGYVKTFNGKQVMNTPLVGSIGWISTHNESDYCFTQQIGSSYGRTGIGFILNATAWRWNNTIIYIDLWDCSSGNCTVTTTQNNTDDIWVQRR